MAGIWRPSGEKTMVPPPAGASDSVPDADSDVDSVSVAPGAGSGSSPHAASVMRLPTATAAMAARR